ncbi:glycoside hydrolase family 78 protein [Amylocarpus encephaloides]|uniref:Glycoside hydrolase family 78 protein n=1 Tax=Amylocarpus encephaloides TaxID=45428 RepID=A0A9P7YS39_9HELO|nr:glycoside hydrolase family 78 protein [Amylocarpus encephaloides]
MMFFAAFLITLSVFLTHHSYRSPSMVAAQCFRTACSGPSTAAFPGNWDQYNYSPASRIVTPVRVLGANKEFIANYPIPLNFKGDNQILIFDFGKEVGGLVSFSYTARGSGQVGLAFSESLNWAGPESDFSNGSSGPDGAIYADIPAATDGNYTMPLDKIRGGFRYLTLFTKASNPAGIIEVDITDLIVEIGFQPSWQNLRAYQGYFSSSDELLNKIWYAGAYTLQTNAIPPDTGRAFPIIGRGWENNENLNQAAGGSTSGSTIYVDGSKRDRTVWSGDLTIAIPSILVSTGDVDGIRNTLQVLYNDQNGQGALPFAGPAINIYNSDTYHMSVLIGTFEYFLYTNDKGFLSGIWDRFTRAMTYITAKIDSSGSIYVTGTDDWGRIGQGAHNTEAQMLMYRTLITASALATWQGDSALASQWTGQASTLKVQINSAYWDAGAGAFKNSDVDATVYPEDANSMSLAFSAADDSKRTTISQSLTRNWGPIGAICPELPNNIVAYVESFEIKGHMVARHASRALDLIRRSWGWYLQNPLGTGSTTIEGYLADGSFGYRFAYGYPSVSYTSHAHGWGTGPTDTLTTYLVGLRLTQPAGSAWSLDPQFGDVTHAEAGFVTPLGRFTASWTLVEGGYALRWDVPAGTKGVLVLPAKGRPPTLASANVTAASQGDYDSGRDVVVMEVRGAGDIQLAY